MKWLLSCAIIFCLLAIDPMKVCLTMEQSYDSRLCVVKYYWCNSQTDTAALNPLMSAKADGGKIHVNIVTVFSSSREIN